MTWTLYFNGRGSYGAIIHKNCPMAGFKAFNIRKLQNNECRLSELLIRPESSLYRSPFNKKRGSIIFKVNKKQYISMEHKVLVISCTSF